ncbi:MAG: penicillin-binding protein 2 [Deltaproteobacteria bacterium GWC2_65_14]|nr:MAG: penicillin-binding protein 2 [Deltaproteobacteria bacterium GWC2_65_14]
MRERIRQREQDPWVGARIGLLQWIALGFFLLLLGRLYWMQVVRSEHFRTLSENNRLRLRAIRAPRGVILDRKGRSIAETAASFDLICFPGDVPDLERELRLLAEVVDFDPAETRERILAAKRKNPFKSITVARDIRFEQVSVIELNREALPGFSILVEAKRSYPFGAQFAHVLGYVGEASEEELDPGDNGGVFMGDLVGKNGLEKTWGSALRGENGGRYVEVDAAGRDRRLVREVTPRRGDTVQTTLDAEIQKAAYDAMGTRAGAVIAMDPRSGEILALVSTPAYDPNLFSRKLKAEEWQALVRNPRNPMQSKGVQGTYAPGSTVKPLLVLEALESGAQDPRAAVSCNGSFTLGNRSFRCWKEKGHGRVDMYKAVVQSCDVYFYTLGLKLDPDRVAELERRMGLGVQTGIDLPGERKGLVPDVAWKREARKERWLPSDSVLLGIGQGAIHVTPLGMLSAYSAIAAEGKVVRPRLVRRILRFDGTVEEVPEEVKASLQFRPETAAFLKRSLSGVVNDHGTGGAAKLPGIEVGGKSGTAQVAAMKGKRVKSEHLPYEIRDHAWFVGFAPVQEPEIAVVAMVEHGGHGGSAAAPIVKAVMQEYFRIRQAEGSKGGT